MLAPGWQFCGENITLYQTMFLVSGVFAVLLLILIPTLPAVVPEHHDYYEPMR